MNVLDPAGWAAAGVQLVSVGDLAARVRITPAAVRYHCTHGQLLGKAFKIGQEWWIPADVADEFADKYTPQPGGRQIGSTDKTRRRPRPTSPAGRSHRRVDPGHAPRKEGT